MLLSYRTAEKKATFFGEIEPECEYLGSGILGVGGGSKNEWLRNKIKPHS